MFNYSHYKSDRCFSFFNRSWAYLHGSFLSLVKLIFCLLVDTASFSSAGFHLSQSFQGEGFRKTSQEEKKPCSASVVFLHSSSFRAFDLTLHVASMCPEPKRDVISDCKCITDNWSPPLLMKTQCSVSDLLLGPQHCDFYLTGETQRSGRWFFPELNWTIILCYGDSKVSHNHIFPYE